MCVCVCVCVCGGGGGGGQAAQRINVTKLYQELLKIDLYP